MFYFARSTIIFRRACSTKLITAIANVILIDLIIANRAYTIIAKNSTFMILIASLTLWIINAGLAYLVA